MTVTDCKETIHAGVERAVSGQVLKEDQIERRNHPESRAAQGAGHVTGDRHGLTVHHEVAYVHVHHP